MALVFSHQAIPENLLILDVLNGTGIMINVLNALIGIILMLMEDVSPLVISVKLLIQFLELVLNAIKDLNLMMETVFLLHL